MITPVSSERCWTFAAIEESPHYLTHPEAVDALQDMPAGVQLEQMSVPCYHARCDGCGFLENEDASEGSTHFPAYEPRHVRVDLEELKPAAGGRLLCPACALQDPTAPKPAPAPVLEFLTWLLSLDDPFDRHGQAERDTVTIVQVLDRAHGTWHALGLPTNRPAPDSAQPELL